MNEVSKTSGRAISLDTINVISSPASASGAMPSVKPDGPMTVKSGPAPVLANLSPRQAKDMGLLTSGTYGRLSFTSLSSVRLQHSLVNKLRAKTALSGSTLFRLIWKQRTTISGLRISALRASAHRMSDKDSISSAPWITPQTHDVTTRGNVMADHHYSPHDLSNQALLATTPLASGWPTPNSTNGDKSVRTQAGAEKEAKRKRLEQRPLHSGLVNGAWTGADWIYCRDEKYRPVEAGTFPLAHGIANRVGKLRGYGNAIVAPVATAFIESYLEVEEEYVQQKAL